MKRRRFAPPYRGPNFVDLLNLSHPDVADRDSTPAHPVQEFREHLCDLRVDVVEKVRAKHTKPWGFEGNLELGEVGRNPYLFGRHVSILVAGLLLQKRCGVPRAARQRANRVE